VAWAIEGTRHYGLGLARYLAGHGRQVAEIDATRHVARRRAGKSDRIDAVRAADELQARPHPAQMRGHGACSHAETQAYVQRRRAEGKTDREIRRCIKRYLARHLFRSQPP
jgi:transposase